MEWTRTHAERADDEQRRGDLRGGHESAAAKHKQREAPSPSASSRRRARGRRAQ